MSNEAGAANNAAGFMCGAAKEALPEGVLTPGQKTPSFGSEGGNQAGEASMMLIKKLAEHVMEPTEPVMQLGGQSLPVNQPP